MLLILLSMLFQAQDVQVHDFHVSRCTVAYSAESGTLENTLYLFLDDLEIAAGIERTMPDSLREKKIVKYVLSHFALMKGEERVPLHCIGMEISEDLQAQWIYLESEKVEAALPLGVENSLLCDLYNDQQNIVSYSISDAQEKTILMHKSLVRHTFVK